MSDVDAVSTSVSVVSNQSRGARRGPVFSVAAPASFVRTADYGNRYYPRFGKRVLDVSLVLIFAPLTLAIVGFIAFVVMLDGGSPFFGHRRVGQGGREFRCWKIRSMVVNAEARLQEYLEQNPEAKREWETNLKLEHDPRVTSFGKFLRRSSLDELPQLWNVLRGDMSLVGARPVTAGELGRYGSRLPAYLAQKPGVTGKWQVMGRNAMSYDDRVSLDASYLPDCSLATDIKLILATFVVMVRRTGR